MKINAVQLWMAVVVGLLLSGCGSTTPLQPPKKPEIPKVTWDDAQKKQLLSILAKDKYMSICNQQTLYEKVKVSQEPQQMTNMLYVYTKNLANGCIVNARQKEEISGQTTTTYGIYEQKVDANELIGKLQDRQSIEEILKPYVPQYREFNALIAKYHAMERSDKSSSRELRQVRLNIERVKLLKPGLGNNYALVNIPEFHVRIVDGSKTCLKMKVITGTKKNKTPIFSENLQYITLNPTWNVPDSIARNEIIPATLRNPGYLKSHRLEMHHDYNLNSPKLKFNAAEAKDYKGGKGPVPFKFIEVPSDRNALGRVKFIFPNQHSVYMHDTPTKNLFNSKVRAFSHGCIRLGDPKNMLKYLTENYTNANYADVKKKYESYKTHHISVSKHLPVHTAYLTTYVTQDGKLLVFPDIYGYDQTQHLNF